MRLDEQSRRLLAHAAKACGGIDSQVATGSDTVRCDAASRLTAEQDMSCGATTASGGAGVSAKGGVLPWRSLASGAFSRLRARPDASQTQTHNAATAKCSTTN